MDKKHLDVFGEHLNSPVLLLQCAGGSDVAQILSWVRASEMFLSCQLNLPPLSCELETS